MYVIGTLYILGNNMHYITVSAYKNRHTYKSIIVREKNNAHPLLYIGFASAAIRFCDLQ